MPSVLRRTEPASGSGWIGPTVPVIIRNAPMARWQGRSDEQIGRNGEDVPDSRRPRRFRS